MACLLDNGHNGPYLWRKNLRAITLLVSYAFPKNSSAKNWDKIQAKKRYRQGTGGISSWDKINPKK
jgi:hypothetical protein